MLRSTLLSIPIILSHAVHAQCDPSVPSSAQVISADGTYAVNGAIWVCPGVTATITGNFVNAFVETGAHVISSINLGVYSVKADGSLTISGFNSNIQADPEANIIDNGTNSVITDCSDLDFNYDDAPGDGCAVQNSVTEHAPHHIALFPNPASGTIQIRSADGIILGSSLYDAQGRVLSSRLSESGQLDLSEWGAGSYSVCVRTAHGTSTHRFLVY